MSRKKDSDRSVDKDEIRLAAEANLDSFIRLVSPKQVLGSIHSEWIRWATRKKHKSHQLTLLPRDHQKSRLIAYRTAWHITRHPDCRILYISSTADLAEKQLKFIKDILTSSIYSRYWPEMVNPDEGKRERWTLSEMAVDHPLRKEEGVRDPTIFTGGLTTGLVGKHCDIAVMDDLVTGDNAYTKEGRDKVLSQYSLLTSIEGADSEGWVVGTRYHPDDLYGKLISMQVEKYDEEGEIIDYDDVYETFQREVEDAGDGTGEFLWPRQQRSDGRWFGFDRNILARKRAQYLDKTQFRAQYYNDPNDSSNPQIDRGLFQYYDKKYLKREAGKWYIQGKRLNVFGAIDFAFSRSQKADYTAIAVIGIDANSNIYVLDLERIKTGSISDYYELILDKHVYWDIRKLRAETNAAQQSIVHELKFQYLLPNGISLSIDEKSRNKNEGTKEERIAATLVPRYENGMIWHYQGGECQNLEEELVLQHSPHDDLKDALASAIEIAVPPVSQLVTQLKSNVLTHSRFGGVAFK